uniref:F-box associated beta-propeller type 3 domain-containing protein n=1 Tax=Lactuca sativa TaxID=4236 RepID=A0A9R1WBQ4_LACSA|nr:hypothetical protein LSAT_V11C200094700 [Lactuca sativa]
MAILELSTIFYIYYKLLYVSRMFYNVLDKYRHSCVFHSVLEYRSFFLLDDFLFDILRRLPADILRYKARFVCRRWFSIITNRILRDHASFIVQRSSGPHTAIQVVIREEKHGLELEQQQLDIPCKFRLKSWCNEFLLIVDPNRKESLYVFNLMTKQALCLPGCMTSCGGHYTSKCGLALAFDGFKGIYKAIHVFMGPPIECKIIVFNRDISSHVCSMWKKIQVPSYDMGEGQYYWGNPVSVQGRYFHWDVHCSNYLVSIDMVKEKIFQMSLPAECNDDQVKRQYSLFEMSGFLALLDDVSWNHADLWILKDIQKMKWEKLQSISVPSYVNTRIYPVCSVISMRYLIFKKSSPKPGLFSYDLTNEVIKELNIHCGDSERCVVHSAAPSFL